MELTAQIYQISALEIGKDLNMVLQVMSEVEILFSCSLFQGQLQNFSDRVFTLELHLLELHQLICLLFIGHQLGQLWIIHLFLAILTRETHAGFD